MLEAWLSCSHSAVPRLSEITCPPQREGAASGVFPDLWNQDPRTGSATALRLEEIHATPQGGLLLTLFSTEVESILRGSGFGYPPAQMETVGVTSQGASPIQALTFWQERLP